MAKNGDSRPFVVLRQNAEDFRSAFDADIKSCIDLLDSKLTTLICDPDSPGGPTKDAKKLSVHLEFTKAKYDIFMNMKSLWENMETSWKEQLEEMKNSFLENVEILLASMKLTYSKDKNFSSSPRKDKRLPERQSPNVPSIRTSIIDTAKRIPVLNSILMKNAHVDDLTRTPCVNAYSVATAEEDDQGSDEEEVEDIPQPQQSSRQSRRSTVKKSPTFKKNSVSSIPTRKGTIKGRKSILKQESLNDSELHATPSRSTRKRTAVKEIPVFTHESDSEGNESDPEELNQAAPKTPKNVHFSMGYDINEDLEICSKEASITRSAPRRKTILDASALESSSDVNSTPNALRSKPKRKTFGGGAMDVSAAPSPKRLKREGRASVTPAAMEETEKSDLSDSDESTGAEHYTPWLYLDELDGKISSKPGVYELKVYKAKKSAYIGSCSNLREKLTLHKIGQNSGHKHLDKFLERNRKDVQVRYEQFTDAHLAEKEKINRIKAFVGQHKTTPAYN